MLFMGATFAAIRLQRLIGPQVGRIGKGAALTARELAVLRQLSMGHHNDKSRVSSNSVRRLFAAT